VFCPVIAPVRAVRRSKPTPSQKPGINPKTFISNVDIVKIMKHEHGFTLVELLITILVASLLMALAVPAFHSFVENNRLAASTNQIVTALAVARSEAIHRRETVTLCSSTDTAAAVPTCAVSASWETGWIAFTDRNGNGVYEPLAVPPEVLLRVWEGIPTGHTLTATGGMTQVRFDRLGVASAGDTFRLANPDCRTGQANRERDVFLLTSGSVRVARADCP
jgi:type IV fimbrial biogenesis protein FimT